MDPKKQFPPTPFDEGGASMNPSFKRDWGELESLIQNAGLTWKQ